MLRFAAFAQRTDSTIGSPFGSGISFLPDGRPLLMARNFGGSSAVGGEIGIKGHSASGLRWNLSYALAAVSDDTPKAQLASAPLVSYQRQTPTHSIIAGAGYTWKRLEIDTQARWQSHIEDFTANLATTMIEPVTVPNYITVNVRVGYRVTDRVTVSVLAEQLNQHTIVETAGLQVDRSFIAGIEARF